MQEEIIVRFTFTPNHTDDLIKSAVNFAHALGFGQQILEVRPERSVTHVFNSDIKETLDLPPFLKSDDPGWR